MDKRKNRWRANWLALALCLSLLAGAAYVCYLNTTFNGNQLGRRLIAAGSDHQPEPPTSSPAWLVFQAQAQLDLNDVRGSSLSEKETAELGGELIQVVGKPDGRQLAAWAPIERAIDDGKSFKNESFRDWRLRSAASPLNGDRLREQRQHELRERRSTRILDSSDNSDVLLNGTGSARAGAAEWERPEPKPNRPLQRRRRVLRNESKYHSFSLLACVCLWASFSNPAFTLFKSLPYSKTGAGAGWRHERHKFQFTEFGPRIMML